MAEAAGLAIGAIALIGLVTDCLDLFSYISASRSLGQDYEILNTKLDIEKTLFLQWIQRVKLLTSDHDKRLDDPQTQAMVTQSLASIRLLLTEGQVLRDRYGLQEDSDHVDEDIFITLSSPRMNEFVKGFRALDLRIKQKRTNVSKIDRVRWVAVDKDKFNRLVGELAYFITKLHDIVPPAPMVMSFMAQEDLRYLPTLRRLRLVYDASTGQDKIMALEAEQLLRSNCEKRILQQIWFRTMDDRREAVKLPYSQTMEWALDISEDHTKWANIPQWLQSDSQPRIYWLSGKAGSGKSTLMKHLCTDSRLRHYLQSWAKERELLVESFFFWNIGTSEQKSHRGLWRALLFKILDHNRALIPVLLPNMWREIYDLNDENISLPTPAEFEFAFSRLVELKDSTDAFCFFIDGLDEYSGNYNEAIAFIDRLANLPNFKFVISSRPIPPCVQAYNTKPKMNLQDLTRADMEIYVNNTVKQHPYAKVIMDIDSSRATAILDDLVDKSSGVFLWVVLACQSIVDGFDNFDRIEDLEQRVKELPPELGLLFRHMLMRIEPRYQEQAARLLWLLYQHHSIQGINPLATMGVAAVDEWIAAGGRTDLALNLSYQKREKCLVLEGRIRSRCCGLLEIVEKNVQHKDLCFCDVEFDAGSHRHLHDKLVDSSVSFIHRSVFEFLQMPEVQDLEYLHFQKTRHLQPALLLSHMSLQLLRLSVEESRYKQADSYLRDALFYLDVLDPSEAFFQALPLIRGLEDVIQESSCAAGVSVLQTVTDIMDLTVPDMACPAVLVLAVERGLVAVVQMLERASNTYSESLNSLEHASLLHHAINRPCWGGLVGLDSSPVMVAYLLASGCNSRLLINGSTPWAAWVEAIKSSTRYQLYDPEVHDATRCFIEAGAAVELTLLYDTFPLMESFARWIHGELVNPASKKVNLASSAKLFQLIKDQSVTEQRKNEVG
ncbi:prion-inhibition and propagation-domain-containing protein [Xylaria curta]|nr:prion-inhibition and propagation-domain-containing protein [Xylaria curta]